MEFEKTLHNREGNLKEKSVEREGMGVKPSVFL